MDLSWNPVERRGYVLARRHGCMECHALKRAGKTYGEAQYEAPELDDMDSSLSHEEFTAIIRNAGEELGTLDMPLYDHLDPVDLQAVASWLRRLNPPK